MHVHAKMLSVQEAVVYNAVDLLYACRDLNNAFKDF